MNKINSVVPGCLLNCCPGQMQTIESQDSQDQGHDNNSETGMAFEVSGSNEINECIFKVAAKVPVSGIIPSEAEQRLEDYLQTIEKHVDDLLLLEDFNVDEFLRSLLDKSTSREGNMGNLQGHVTRRCMHYYQVQVTEHWLNSSG